MTRRPKLSLEPDRQVRREPPTELSSPVESAEPAPPAAQEKSPSVEPAERSAGADRQVRREPPAELSSPVESAEPGGPAAAQETSPSVERSDRSSGPEHPSPDKKTGAAPSHYRSPPRFSSKDAGRTPPPPRPVGRTRVDGAALVKILLVAGIAALSILLLKRRFF